MGKISVFKCLDTRWSGGLVQVPLPETARDPVSSTFQAHSEVWQDRACLSTSTYEAPGSAGAVWFQIRKQRGFQLFAALPVCFNSIPASPSLTFITSIIAQKLQKKQS